MGVGNEARREKKLFHLFIANPREKAILSSVVSSDFSNDPCTFSSKKIFVGGRFKHLFIESMENLKKEKY